MAQADTRTLLLVTHLAVPFMPVLRHLPRQEVNFSGAIDIPIASMHWVRLMAGLPLQPEEFLRTLECWYLRLLGVAAGLAADVAERVLVDFMV